MFGQRGGDIQEAGAAGVPQGVGHQLGDDQERGIPGSPSPAAPRDLVMVPKSEVIGHLSPVAGVYWDVALDPLALALGGTGEPSMSSALASR